NLAKAGAFATLRQNSRFENHFTKFILSLTSLKHSEFDFILLSNLQPLSLIQHLPWHLGNNAEKLEIRRIQLLLNDNQVRLKRERVLCHEFLPARIADLPRKI